jgi:hypothetical protein
MAQFMEIGWHGSEKRLGTTDVEDCVYFTSSMRMHIFIKKLHCK